MIDIKKILWLLLLNYFFILFLLFFITKAPLSFSGIKFFFELYVLNRPPVHRVIIFCIIPILLTTLTYFIFLYEYDNKFNRIYTECAKEKSKMLSRYQEEKRTLKSDYEKLMTKKYEEGIDVFNKEREYYQEQLSSQVNLIAEVKKISEDLLSVKKKVIDLIGQVQHKEKNESNAEIIVKNRDEENINTEESKDEPIRFCTLVDVAKEKEID